MNYKVPVLFAGILIAAAGCTATNETKEYEMSAPSKAVVSKLDNPAHVKVSHRHGINLHG